MSPERRTFGRADAVHIKPLSYAEFVEEMKRARRMDDLEARMLALDWGRVSLAAFAAAGWSATFALVLTR